MDQKVLYSMMGLAALPLGAEAAIVQGFEQSNWNGAGLTLPTGSNTIVSNGTTASHTIQQLLPGTYTLTCDVVTKVYDVTVAITGADGKEITSDKAEANSDGNVQRKSLTFQITKTQNITLSFTSARPNESGSDYSFTAPVLDLTFNFKKAQEDLNTLAGNVIKAIEGYDYAGQDNDLKAAKALEAEITKIEETYKDYQDYELYAEPSKIKKQLNDLDLKASTEQNYSDTKKLITASTLVYNQAVADLEEELIEAAEYLYQKDGVAGPAKKELDEIKSLLAQATEANEAARTPNKNTDWEKIKEGIPTEKTIQDIVKDYTDQSKDNKAKYKALDDKVKELKKALNDVKPSDESKVKDYQKEKEAAQKAIDAIEAKVKGVYNTAGQLTANIDTDVTSAQGLIDALKSTVDAANAQYDANQEVTDAIKDLQTMLDEAKAEVNALKYGENSVEEYYAEYVAALQKTITDLTNEAADAYKEGNSISNKETALKTIKNAKTQIEDYTKGAAAAAENYATLQKLIKQYTDDIEGVRETLENYDIYTDGYESDGYDFKTKLDLMLKEVHDVEDDIAEAKGKKGSDHWDAMEKISFKEGETITNRVKKLLQTAIEAEGKYTAEQLEKLQNTLTFGTFALGNDLTIFENGADEITGDIQKIIDALKANTGNDQKAQDELDAQKANITAIQPKIDALLGAAKAVDALIKAAEGSQSKLNTDLTTLNTNVGKLSGTEGLGLSEKDFYAKVTALQGDISALQTANGSVPTTTYAETKVDKSNLTNLAGGVYVVTTKDGDKTNSQDYFVPEGGTLNVKAEDVESITYHDFSKDATYNNPNKDKDDKTIGLTNQYTELNDRYGNLIKEAEKIQNAVAKNAETLKAANEAVAALEEAELKALKDIKDVTKTDASLDNPKADPSGWQIFEDGLSEGKPYYGYTKRKGDIENDIQDLKDAIAASANAEKLTDEWKNSSITVGEGEAAKTYSINAITETINKLAADAVAEGDNWRKYVELSDAAKKIDTDIIKLDPEKVGSEAMTYYEGVVTTYGKDKADIQENLKKSLNARTAIKDASGLSKDISDLDSKVKSLQKEAEDNYAMYLKQKDAYKSAYEKYDSVYAAIAGNDNSSLATEYLNQLKEQKTKLDAAKKIVDDSYPKGESVKNQQEIAEIESAIIKIGQTQHKGYDDAIAADNLNAHEAFKAAIEITDNAYKTAAQARAAYSATNKEVAKAIEDAATELDNALYGWIQDIQDLKAKELNAFNNTVSPKVFNVKPYTDEADGLTADIKTAQETFEKAVETALQGFWNSKTADFASKIKEAKDDVADYKFADPKNAFSEVEKWITQGESAIKSKNLEAIEKAIEALANIDGMLTSAKENIAKADIEAGLKKANDTYNEVKSYLAGISLAVARTQENVLNNSYKNNITDNAANVEEFEHNFDNHNDIVGYINTFLTAADNSKTTVEKAVENDVDNTKAYNELMAAYAPIADKLAKAKAAAAPYKHVVSTTIDEDLAKIQTNIENAKSSGSAVSQKTDIENAIKAFDKKIEEWQESAFNYEKNGLLSTDIPELKNQYNAFMAGIQPDDDKAIKEAADIKNTIESFTKEVNGMNVDNFDANEPKNGVDFNELIKATEAMVDLQTRIANYETELLEKNKNQDNGNETVRESLRDQLNKLKSNASEEYADWVLGQTLDGQTLSAWLEDILDRISALEDAITSEANISFFKKQYQEKIDAVSADLETVLKELGKYQAKYDTNNAVYANLFGQLQALQDKVNAAKAKVTGYDYTYDWYLDIIERYEINDDDERVLIGGVQYNINQVKASLDADNKAVNLEKDQTLLSKYRFDINQQYNNVQKYLDESAYDEIWNQADALTKLVDDKYSEAYYKHPYSKTLWEQVKALKNEINTDIRILRENNNYSYRRYDENGDEKPCTSDQDYNKYMQTVGSIGDKIDNLTETAEQLGMLGDVDGNRIVDVRDYNLVKQMILNPDDKTYENWTNLDHNADVNGNKVIEVGDLTAIVNYILTNNMPSNNTPSYYAKGFGSRGSESLTMEIVEMQQGVQRLAVNLQNVADYTAFQLDVLLPEGMNIVGTTLSDRAGASHMLYSNKQADGSLRLLASSIKAETFSGNEGAVLYIDVETTNAFNGGEIELLNVLFSDVNAQTRAFSVAGNGDEATGIDMAAAIESLKQKVYDLNGRMMNGLKKGINIIRRADGTTEKILK